MAACSGATRSSSPATKPTIMHTTISHRPQAPRYVASASAWPGNKASHSGTRDQRGAQQGLIQMIRVRPPPRPTQPSAESAGDMHERACPGIQTVLISDTTIRVQSTGDPVRHRHRVVSVRAESVRRLESPDAYTNVPRRTRGRDGCIRPWPPDG